MLQSDLAEDPALRFRRHAFFGFDGGRETGGPSAVQRNTAFEPIDHFDRAILDDVVDIPVQQGGGVQCLVDCLVCGQIVRVEEISAPERALDGLDSDISQCGIVPSGIDGEVLAGTKPAQSDPRRRRSRGRPIRRRR